MVWKFAYLRKGEIIMKETIKTLIKGFDVELFWCPEVNEIEKLISEKVIPIEMAEGDISYIDDFCLDHHNDLSYLPAASITALQYYGKAVKDNTVRIMVNHVDADSVVCGLTIMGLISKDILEAFNLDIAILDVDPMSVKAIELPYGKQIQIWKNAMSSVKQSGWAYLYGMQLFIDILENPNLYQRKMDAAEEQERNRIEAAIQDLKEGIFAYNGKIVVIPESNVFGFDVHYGRDSYHSINSLQGWKRCCVIARVPKSGTVTIGCPNKEVAEELFGNGGLLNVFPKLPKINNKSWGGRESIGGSPRGEIFPKELLEEVLDIVNGCRMIRI